MLNIFGVSADNSIAKTKFEKSLPLVCIQLLRTNPLIYNTMHFDQYSRPAIRLNILSVSSSNSKMNLKFEKKVPFVRRAVGDASIVLL